MKHYENIPDDGSYKTEEDVAIMLRAAAKEHKFDWQYVQSHLEYTCPQSDDDQLDFAHISYQYDKLSRKRWRVSELFYLGGSEMDNEWVTDHRTLERAILFAESSLY